MQKASLAASGMLTWPALATFTGLAGAIEQPIDEGVEVLGRELVGGPVVRSANPRDDQAGPVEHVPLHPGRVEVFTGLADREGGGRGFLI
jgi:hypothetical protein